MHIKKVKIQGFKSYRDEQDIPEFHAGHNVIVGRNGSGKSNFFNAIQFVLSDDFNNLSQANRQELLHESTGQRAMTAYVEIVFDNQDQRIPIEKNEVVLRRIIGAKKDQYFIDKKLVTKTDVSNLLESAGFSRSNPYYIVKQGKISTLTTASDVYRLKLLREVAGTKVYDDRKEESEKILAETQSKREKIAQLLAYITERINTLEEETKELREYQRWDKLRRAVDYTIYDNELKDTRRKLDELQSKRELCGKNAEEWLKQAADAQKRVEDAQRSLRDLRMRIQTENDEKDQLLADVHDVHTQRTRVELQLRDLNREIETQAERAERMRADLNEVQTRIGDTQKRLREIEPQYDSLRAREEDLARRMAISEQRKKELYAKQGRTAQFHSRADRDRWIRQQIDSLRRAKRDKDENIGALTNEIKTDEKRLEHLKTEIANVNTRVSRLKTETETDSRMLNELRKKRDALTNQRNGALRSENQIRQRLDMSRDESGKIEQQLRGVAGKTVLNGMDSVRRVLDTFRLNREHPEILQGYHGLFIDLFRVPEEYTMCVEVTAGNRLFFHVVEDDRMATDIMKRIDELRLPGEVNFMPLNRLFVDARPAPNDTAVQPLVDKLEFEPRFASAMRLVFGRTLISRDLEQATLASRKFNMDCVTLDGDQVSRKGAMTGGFHERRRLRYELYKQMRTQRDDASRDEQQLADHAAQLRTIDDDVTRTMSEMQKVEARSRKNEDTLDGLHADVKRHSDELRSLEEAVPKKRTKLRELELEQSKMGEAEKAFESELASEMSSQLDADDSATLETLKHDISSMQTDHRDAFNQRISVEQEKMNLENLLEHNLKLRKANIENQLGEIRTRNMTDRLAELRDEQQRLSNECQTKEQRARELTTQLDQLRTDEQELQRKLEEYRSKEKQIQETQDRDAKGLESITSKQSVLMKKKDDLFKRIRDLGALPADELEQVRSLSAKQLESKLKRCNDELKKYSHVNQKAIEQYNEFRQQRTELEARQRELDASYSAIKELIDTLDLRKAEAIETTFKQVSRNFADIFIRLVPTGFGELALRVQSGHANSGGESSQVVEWSFVEHRAPFPSLDSIVGVSMKVSFIGGGEMKDLHQLSGGQKALVALTIIFAIQKCDPAPFYLFDEIDAALDAQHRKAVAEMVQELSKHAQYITTTFRPELLECADRHYGVQSINKVSYIRPITEQEAREFVEYEQGDERQPQRASTTATDAAPSTSTSYVRGSNEEPMMFE